MMKKDLETIEIDLLLEAIYRRSGYDFRSYARASVDRRILQFKASNNVAHIADLIPRLLHEEDLLADLVRQFSICVTEMFRDPFFYASLRENVIPLLRTYPSVKIWHAGCATGEEVYSLAILLAESGLYSRSIVYGTDFNDRSLERARQGIYPITKMKDYTRNYQRAGGVRSFAEYYHARYDAAVMDSALKQQLTFANHNLVSDAAFGEMHMVICRNVLIYFNKELQKRVLRLMTDSLTHGGFLCLGTKENILFSDVEADYEVVDKKAKIFRKKVAH